MKDLGSAIDKGTDEDKAKSGASRIGKPNKGKIANARNKCRDLIKRMNREKGELTRRYDSAKDTRDSFQRSKASVEEDISSVSRQLASLPADE